MLKLARRSRAAAVAVVLASSMVLGFPGFVAPGAQALDPVGHNQIGGDADCNQTHELRDAVVTAQGLAGKRSAAADCEAVATGGYSIAGCDVATNSGCDTDDVVAMLSCAIGITAAACADAALGPCPGDSAATRWGSSFVVPAVTLSDEHPGSAGSQAWARLLPDLEELSQAIAAEVAAELYLESADVPVFNTIAIKIVDDPQTVASNSSSRPTMTIRVGSRYIAAVAAWGDTTARDELVGMLTHEIVHGYQATPFPLNATGFQEYLGAIEGVADAVRIRLGRHQLQHPNPAVADRWRAGYTTTGFFLHYLSERYDHQIVPKFNQEANDIGATWNFETAMQSIMGRGIEDLWAEYADYINSGGTLDYDGTYQSNRRC